MAGDVTNRSSVRARFSVISATAGIQTMYPFEFRGPSAFEAVGLDARLRGNVEIWLAL
jgi:hypothetical protein